MSVPRRLAACHSVSPSRISTWRSSIVKVAGLSVAFVLISAPLSRSSARLSQSVVPAKAGTHNRRRFASSRCVQHRKDTAYGSPPSRGRQRNMLHDHPSPASQGFLQLLREIFQHTEQRIGRRLAEAADRGIAHSI